MLWPVTFTGPTWRDLSHAKNRRPRPRSFRKIREVSLDRRCAAQSRSFSRIENCSAGSAWPRVVQSIVVARIDRDYRLNYCASFWPDWSPRTASLSRVEFSYLGILGYWRSGDFSGDASFHSGRGELADGRRRCFEFEHFASCQLLVAGKFRAGGLLFHLHLTTLCRKSKRSAGHPRFLLGRSP